MYLNPLSIAHIVIYRFAFSYGTLKNKFCTCNFYTTCQTFMIISTNICIFPFHISCWILSVKPFFKIQPSQSWHKIPIKNFTFSKKKLKQKPPLKLQNHLHCHVPSPNKLHDVFITKILEMSHSKQRQINQN